MILKRNGFEVITERKRIEQELRKSKESYKRAQAMADLLERNIPYDIEFHIHPGDSGEMRTIHSVAELETDETGNPVKVVGTLHDITNLNKN